MTTPLSQMQVPESDPRAIAQRRAERLALYMNLAPYALLGAVLVGGGTYLLSRRVGVSVAAGVAGGAAGFVAPFMFWGR